MSTKQKMIKLMQVTGMDLWGLANMLGEKGSTLESIQWGTTEPQHAMKQKLTDVILNYHLCPECVSRPMRHGGCTHCHCGWSECG